MLMFPKTLSSAGNIAALQPVCCDSLSFCFLSLLCYFIDNEEEVDYDEKIEMENAESGDDKLRSVKGKLNNFISLASLLPFLVPSYILALALSRLSTDSVGPADEPALHSPGSGWWSWHIFSSWMVQPSVQTL